MALGGVLAPHSCAFPGIEQDISYFLLVCRQGEAFEQVFDDFLLVCRQGEAFEQVSGYFLRFWASVSSIERGINVFSAIGDILAKTKRTVVCLLLVNLISTSATTR